MAIKADEASHPLSRQCPQIEVNRSLADRVPCRFLALYPPAMHCSIPLVGLCIYRSQCNLEDYVATHQCRARKTEL